MITKTKKRLCHTAYKLNWCSPGTFTETWTWL